MKNLKYFLSFLLLILLMFVNLFEVFAMNTGFTVVDSFTEEEKEHIMSVNNLKLLKEEPVNEAIQCFDVNKDGLIAIGTENMNEKYICIYSSDGIFQYGYRFDSEGSFTVEFKDENVNIYFSRSQIVKCVNPEGKIIEIAKVQDTIDNDDYRRYLIYPGIRESGDKKYIPKKDMGIFNYIGVTYSQLVVIDSMGNEKIIYDVNSKMFARRLVTFITVLIALTIVIVALSKLFIKGIRQYKAEEAENGPPVNKQE